MSEENPSAPPPAEAEPRYSLDVLRQVATRGLLLVEPWTASGGGARRVYAHRSYTVADAFASGSLYRWRVLRAGQVQHHGVAETLREAMEAADDKLAGATGLLLVPGEYPPEPPPGAAWKAAGEWHVVECPPHVAGTDRPLALGFVRAGQRPATMGAIVKVQVAERGGTWHWLAVLYDLDGSATHLGLHGTASEAMACADAAALQDGWTLENADPPGPLAEQWIMSGEAIERRSPAEGNRIVAAVRASFQDGRLQWEWTAASGGPDAGGILPVDAALKAGDQCALALRRVDAILSSRGYTLAPYAGPHLVSHWGHILAANAENAT